MHYAPKFIFARFQVRQVGGREPAQLLVLRNLPRRLVQILRVQPARHPYATQIAWARTRIRSWISRPINLLGGPPTAGQPDELAPEEDLRSDLVSALTNLGYNRQVAEKAIDVALKKTPDATFEDALRDILRGMTRA